jgi:hypothetical protein
VNTKEFGIINAEIGLSYIRDKDYKIVVIYRQNIIKNFVIIKFNFTFTAAGIIILAPKSGMGIVNLKPGNTTLNTPRIAITTKFNSTILMYKFDLAHPSGGRLNTPIRIRIPANLADGKLNLSRMDKTNVKNILNSKIITGKVISESLKGLGHFDDLGNIGHIKAIGRGGGLFGDHLKDLGILHSSAP